MVGSLTVLFLITVLILIKESFNELEQNFKIVSAWRSWRLQVIKSRVYNEAEIKNIQFWDKESCIKSFKSANRHKTFHLVYGLIFTGIILFTGIKVYIENEQFHSTLKKTTAIILKISPKGKALYEYRDTEGAAHTYLGHRDLRSMNIKTGDRLNVLYSPDYQELRLDNDDFKHFGSAIILSIALITGLIFVHGHRWLPRFDLNLQPVTTAEELRTKKVS